MTEYRNATLILQWIGSAASAVSVVVAVIFGRLILLNTRRSKDNQERSTRTAAAISEQINESIATGIRAAQPGGSATWSVRPAGGEDWFITWVGQNRITDVRIKGFTELDNRRLGPTRACGTLRSGDSIQITVVSRLSLSRPTNIVVSYAHSRPASRVSDALLVPSN